MMAKYCGVKKSLVEAMLPHPCLDLVAPEVAEMNFPLPLLSGLPMNMYFGLWDMLAPLSLWRRDPRPASSSALWGSWEASPSMDQNLVWAVAPYWPRASCLPYLLVDLHSWLPQVFQAQPLQVKHHQHRLNLPTQLHRTEQVRQQVQLGDPG